MKKLNKKGFILIETLIVTVFVVSLFILIFQSTVPLLGDFEQYNKYEDIDIIYNANLYKQMLSKYANFEKINEAIDSDAYIDISNCNSAAYLENGVSYCNLVQLALGITSDDRILLTEYDISAFKNIVKKTTSFDAGVYSNFRDYVENVSNKEPFYEETGGKTGKYRLFIIKNVVNSDRSMTRKYTNLGIYDGDNENYVIGEKVKVQIAGENKQFFVLKNSDSIDTTVTLIAANNLESSSVGFSKGTETGTLYSNLRARTNIWSDKAIQLSNYAYYSKFDNYTFNYSGMYARLLDEYDIYEVLGCKKEGKECFDPDNAFSLEFDNESFSFLTNGLAGDIGYWTATTVPYTNMYAWAVMDGKLEPVSVNDTTHIGIRPIIVVNKKDISRGW